MKQSHALDNACGVIACIHAILNNLESITLTEGKPLKEFHELSKEDDAYQRAHKLEGFTAFQEEHKSFAG